MEEIIHFEQFVKIKGVDYKSISYATQLIRKFVLSEEFYTNSRNCLRYSFEFILNNANFLMKNAKSGPVLLSLLVLLYEIIARMRDANPIPDCFTVNKHRIMITLNNVMDSYQDDSVKAAGGKIVNGLLAMNNLTVNEDKDLHTLSFKSFIIFERRNDFYELGRLTNTLLKRGLRNCQPITEWINTKCIAYLRNVSERAAVEEEHAVLELLKCLVTHYRASDKIIFGQNSTNNLKSLISHICKLFCNPLLRSTSAHLLLHLIDALYYSASIWPFDNTDILNSIQFLPDNYEEWPTSNADVFFIIVYLQLLHSLCLWTNEVVLQAVNSYMSLHALAPSTALKALAWLYPMLSSENPTPYYSSTGKKLLATLNSYKSLNEFLTYDTTQMAWLLKNADSTFRIRLVVSWLHVKSDVQIIEALNATGTGHLLIQFLVECFDSSVALRVLGLVVQLKRYPYLTNAIAEASPLFCNRPTVYSLLLNMKPAISSDPMEVLNSIKIVSASLPFLMDDAAIQAACSYSMSLLEAVKHQSNAVLLFCHFPATLKFLAVASGSNEDATAIAAIALLRVLLNNQIRNKVHINVNIPLNFVNILQGNEERLRIGLELLQMSLQYKQRPLLLNCPDCFFSGLYHLLCNLLTQKQASHSVLDVLTLLISCEPNLSASPATSYSLRIICVASMDGTERKAFMKFLEMWLGHATNILFADIPIGLLKAVLLQINDCKERRVRIMRVLDKYEQKRW